MGERSCFGSVLTTLKGLAIQALPANPPRSRAELCPAANLPVRSGQDLGDNACSAGHLQHKTGDR